MSARRSATHRRTATRCMVLVAAVGAAYSLLPMWWAVVSSLRSPSAIFQNLYPLSSRTLWVSHPTLTNYHTLGADGFIGVAIRNSLISTSGTVLLGLLIAIPAAFAFVVFDSRFMRALFVFVLISFLVPFEAIAIPLGSTFRSLGLENSYLGLILPAVGNGMAIFLLRQFFFGVPIELLEAARSDGASWLRVLRSVYVPLCRPAIVGAATILFVFQWQSFLWPLIIAPAPNFTVAPVALGEFVGEFQVNYGAMLAGAAVTGLLPALVFVGAQSMFNRSLARSGLVG